MALVEIDETELVNHRNITGLVNRMLQNPAARARVLEARKIIDPNVSIPELDSQKPVITAVTALSDEIKALKKQQEEDKAASAHEKTMSSLKAKWDLGQAKARRAGYTAEGLKSLEDFMEENGIADHAIAMPAFEKLHPPAEPISATSTSFDRIKKITTGGDDMNLLLEGKERQFVDKRIQDALAAVRSGNA